MKTRQGTGYFQQVHIILLLCIISILVSAGSALALTGNDINQCYDCHGSSGDIRPLDTGSASATSYRNITSGAIKGSHRTHVTNMPATLSSAVCTPCHGTAPTTMDHRNGQILMASAVSYTKSPFFNQTSVPVLGTCATASCHANPYVVGGYVTTPTWGTVSGCAACHNNNAGAGAAFDPILGEPLTGAHTKHMSAPNSIACGTCHTNVAKDTNTSSVHINGTIDVNGYVAPVAKHAIGSGYGSCASASCHGAASPNWGTSSSNDTCTKCHGTGTATVTALNRYVVAPPNSVAGTAGTVTGTGQVSNNTKVGAHQTHLRFLNGFSNYSSIDFRCQNCHGSLPVSGSHANGSSAPAFQGLATRGGMTPVWTAGTFTCSNTFCHNPAGSGILDAANGGSRTFVSWTSASYLADGGKSLVNCGKCHKVPGDAGFSKQAAHGSMVTNTTANQCTGCHGHDGDSTGPLGQRHIDGIKYAALGGTTCNGCHSYDATDWATATHNYGGTVANEGIGAHAKHITYIKTRFGVTLNPTTDFAAGFGAGNSAAVCGVCHSNSSSDHMAGNRTINFNGSVVRQFGPNNNPTTWYTGVSTSSSAANPKQCSNIDCHYGLTPLWSTY